MVGVQERRCRRDVEPSELCGRRRASRRLPRLGVSTWRQTICGSVSPRIQDMTMKQRGSTHTRVPHRIPLRPRVWILWSSLRCGMRHCEETRSSRAVRRAERVWGRRSARKKRENSPLRAAQGDRVCASLARRQKESPPLVPVETKQSVDVSKPRELSCRQCLRRQRGRHGVSGLVCLSVKAHIKFKEIYHTYFTGYPALVASYIKDGSVFEETGRQ